MNLEEIKTNKNAFLRLEDICGDVLPCTAKTLRKQLRSDPDSIRFPVVKLGDRFFVPRQQLLTWLSAEEQPGSLLTRK